MSLVQIVNEFMLKLDNTKRNNLNYKANLLLKVKPSKTIICL